jgi:hypothetical protein
VISLQWTIKTSPQCSVLFHLLSPALQELSISFDESTILEMDRVLDSLVLHRPSLTVLDIELRVPSDTDLIQVIGLRTGLVEILRTRFTFTYLTMDIYLFLPAIISHKFPFSNLTKLSLNETLNWPIPLSTTFPRKPFLLFAKSTAKISAIGTISWLVQVKI